MIEKRLCFLFVLWSFSISAQIKGVVKDSITGNPISYANIWVENENVAVNSEENGTFSINTSRTKNLIFSALGYQRKLVQASNVIEVKLSPKVFEIEEVVVIKKLQTKVVEIGICKTSIYQAFDNGPRIDVKYFPYLPKYKKTRNIKQVKVETDSKIDDATIKIHFYNVDNDGYPGEELLKKDFITTVKKGVNKNVFDISNFNLIMPKKGLFVGFERLIIDKNKVETTVTDYNSNTTSIKKKYYPLVLYNFEERECVFSFSGGKWNKDIQRDSNEMPVKRMVNEPAINLILTN